MILYIALIVVFNEELTMRGGRRPTSSSSIRGHVCSCGRVPLPTSRHKRTKNSSENCHSVPLFAGGLLNIECQE